MTRPGYAGCRKPRRQRIRETKAARRARAAKPELETPLAIRRSSQMLILGLAIFVIGAGVVLVSFMGSGGGKDKSATATTSTTIQAGTVLINTAPAAPTSFTIPDGKQAVAIQMPFVAGLAGYAKAGDTVNVYGVIDEKGVGAEPAPPASKLILPGVQVL